ncbi:MAG: ABC transporter ATP-binding protein [Akkermansia sp.]|nr:ABC transporter ATP-binding protein [Akkermansia sp.]
MKPQRGVIASGIFFGAVAAAAAGFGLPFMIQYVFPMVFDQAEMPAFLREIVEKHVDENYRADVVLWAAALIIPLVMTVRGVATYLNSYMLTKAGMRALSELRADMFARLQWLSFSYHDRNSRGGVMTTVIQYTQMVQQGIITVMNDLVIQPLTLVAAVAYLVYAAVTSNESAMLLGNLIISAACVPIVRMVGKRMIKQMRSALSGMNVITATVEETLSAQREVRAFNLEKRQSDVLASHIRHYNGLMIRMAAWRQSVTPAVEMVSALALAYALYCGCSDGLSLEQFTAIAMAFYFCYDPIKRLGSVVNQAQLMQVGIKGIESLLYAKDETPEPTTPVSLPKQIKGDVEFRNVSFSYVKGTPVLRDISVSVAAGQIVGLVGPSGSGKTTFINLICRFYDPCSGSVCLDGVDVKDITREDRTRNIGLVSQFSALFNDSILENIRQGRAGATDDEVRAAATLAKVDEFADSLPGGYNYMLGESGSGLSGGQRQRVSIARAFLKNAPVLILDEATSALDMRSEAAIQDSLEKLAQGHTTFIIAHRFSTLRMAQRILVFENGRIIADGTHRELYESCMLYRGLYDEQVQQEKELKV